MNRYLGIAAVLFSAQVLMKQKQAAPRFSAITAGDEFTCALDSDGKAWCWGANEYGQVGARTTDQCRGVMFVRRDSCQLVPMQVVGEKRFHIIDAGSSHVCALTREGQAYCWGRNTLGELGRAAVPQQCPTDISEPCTYIPLPVETSLRFSAISAGNAFTCALTTEGVPYCWGINKDGTYGAGNIGNGDPRVKRIAAPTTFVQLSSWGSQTCALSTAGEVFCWGEGLGADAQRVELSGKAVSVSRGWGHTCALIDDGIGYCWGENHSGELAAKPLDSLYIVGTPLPITGVPKLEALVAGFGGTCAISTRHQLYCWGSETTLGTRANDRCFDVDAYDGCTWTPARIPLDSVTSLTLGFMHACALAKSGAAYCWGDNGAGALGNGSKRSGVQPEPIDTRRMR